MKTRLLLATTLATGLLATGPATPTSAATTVTVPWLSGDIHDLRGLGRLACHLRGVADQADSS